MVGDVLIAGCVAEVVGVDPVGTADVVAGVPTPVLAARGVVFDVLDVVVGTVVS